MLYIFISFNKLACLLFHIPHSMTGRLGPASCSCFILYLASPIDVFFSSLSLFPLSSLLFSLFSSFSFCFSLIFLLHFLLLLPFPFPTDHLCSPASLHLTQPDCTFNNFRTIKSVDKYFSTA